MSEAPAYRSSIPDSAEERVIETHEDGSKAQAEYWLDGQRVGRRYFFESGELAGDVGLRGDRYHGIDYRWDMPGSLMSAIPYADGLEHGTAHQWGYDGTYLGSYTMEHGTGIDLWRSGCGGEQPALSEVRYYRDGQRHGFEWWLNGDQRSVYEEGHYANGQPHGILRQWNSQGRLRRGYPQYYVNGERVTKRQYLRASQRDPSLPRFSPEDNLPARTFPPEVAQHLGPQE